MTANAMQGDKEKCLQAGMDDYMSKPINTDDLEKNIRRYTNGLPQQPSTDIKHTNTAQEKKGPKLKTSPDVSPI